MKLSLSFLLSRFFYMTRKPEQKFKYLENEKGFKDEIKEIKCIFHDFKGLSLKQIKQFCLKGGRRTLRKNGFRKIPPGKIIIQKIPTSQTPHWKTPPPPPPHTHTHTHKIPTRNIHTHFINCLSSLNTSFWQMFTN